MRKIILSLVITLGLTHITRSQVITCIPCDQLGMSVNVGSDTTSISIYHSGQYMTHPQSENIFTWEFTDQQGNILHQDTIVDGAFCNFEHNWSLTDTVNVRVHFVNDSANLDAWYINQGLPLNGNSINCLFVDQIYWKEDTFANGNPYGYWEFNHSNVGVDQNSISAINESLGVESNYKIFPSPTSNYLNLEGPKEDYSLQILNSQGQLFYEMKNINGNQELDVSHLPHGLYIVNIFYDKYFKTMRFIKQIN